MPSCCIIKRGFLNSHETLVLSTPLYKNGKSPPFQVLYSETQIIDSNQIKPKQPVLYPDNQTNSYKQKTAAKRHEKEHPEKERINGFLKTTIIHWNQ